MTDTRRGSSTRSDWSNRGHGPSNRGHNLLNRGHDRRGGGRGRGYGYGYSHSYRPPFSRRTPENLVKHHFPQGVDRKDHYGIEMTEKTAECDICCLKSDLFAVGPCLHPICMECGIRIRILGKHETCPKCRANIEKMLFVNYTGEWSPEILNISEVFPHEDADRYKVVFGSARAAKCFDSYLAHVCPICKKKGEPREFPTFALLNQHVYMVHRFQYCDICVEHLELLTHERKIYSQLDLARHLEKGDLNDSSQKGHPQCLFCNERFLDEEYQYKHLRKDHFFCHLCDADGISNYFFPEHGDLISHYKKKHIICEEGECKQLGIAFRSEMELKLHQSTQHGVGKQRLNLDFYYGRGGATGGHTSSRERFNRDTHIQRNLPRVGVIPNEDPPEPQRTADRTDVKIVPSMQAQGIEVSLHYSRDTGFKIQGNDFPRLGKEKKQSVKKANRGEGNEGGIMSKEQEKSGGKSGMLNNKPSATTSEFIDDDEDFVSVSETLAQQRKAEDVDSAGPSNRKFPEETQPVKPSYSAAFFRPNSLSNIAAKLRNDIPTSGASEAFPSLSLSNEEVVKLPANSVWRHNNLQFNEKPQIVSCVVPKKTNNFPPLEGALPKDGSRLSQRKKLPEPDIWPQQSVPSNWEERAVDTTKLQKSETVDKTLRVMKAENFNKTKRGKKVKAKLQRQQEQESDSKDKQNQGLEAGTSVKGSSETGKHSSHNFHNDDINENPGVDFSAKLSGLAVDDTSQSLSDKKLNETITEENFSPSSEIRDEASVNEDSEKPMVSTTFASLLNGFSKFTQPEAGSSDAASLSEAVKSSNVVEETLDKEKADSIASETLSLPPGIVPPRPPGLAPPPGFGPPPGFESKASNAT